MTNVGPYFITGATGFVGACLARELVERGEEVHLLIRNASNLWRIDELKGRAQFHEGDVMEPAGLKEIIEKVKPHTIFHLAAYGAYPTKQVDAAAILATNLLGTVNLVKACEGIDYAAFINTGSSSEYGIKNHPMKEQDLPEPYSDYGVAKVAATLFCQNYARTHKRPLLTYRLFSVYGPYEEGFRLIPSVMTACVDRQPIRLSRPHPVRDFIHVDDVVEAYLCGAMKASKCGGEVFNIGTGDQHSIGEMVEIMGKVMPDRPSVEWGTIENPRTEPEVWRANIIKAKTMLEWRSIIDLESGLSKNYDWFRLNRSLYS